MWWLIYSVRSTRSDMPELLEVESYASAATSVIGRVITDVDAHDEWYLKRATTREQLEAVLPGLVIEGVRRIGKLMLIDTDGPVIGLRFGMTGRLLVDGSASIDHLEYSSRRDNPGWVRFALGFGDGGRLSINDPRRLGGIELDPDETRLGPDAASVSLDELSKRISGSAAKVKAALLDQHRISGLGNLLVDEILWRVGISPMRAACDLTGEDLASLYAAIGETIRVLRRRGGSHTGGLQMFRVAGALCPRDGAALLHDTVGGRSTWWCPLHQA